MTLKLILASASPRRAELLRQIDVQFEIKAVDIDETPFKDEQAYDYVKRLALEKARTATAFYPQHEFIVLGSDTTVVINGDILGKPENKEHAFDMLRKLSGVTHKVLTSVAIIGQEERCIVNESHVTFAKLTDNELEWYWSTGEPEGKAGAYGIQGQAAVFISRLEGSFSGVMGLPLFETTQLLIKSGFDVAK